MFGEESLREREDFGVMGRQKSVEVESIGWWHLSSTQSIPNLRTGHPSAEKGPETIPHTSWE
jgi:hypothetical protein